MKNYPSVSILLPTYNRGSYLPMAIETCLAQDYPNLKIIIGDDASTDDTENIIKKYLSDKRIVYLRNDKNLGFSKNTAKLLYKHTESDFFLQASDDDYFIDSSYISKAVSLLTQYENMVLVHSNIYWVHENKKGLVTANVKDLPEIENGLWYFLNWKNDIYFYTPTVLCKANIAKKLNCFSGDEFSDDWKCWLKFCLNGDIGYINSKVVAYRVHSDNISAVIDIDKNINGALCIKEAYDYAKKLNNLNDKLLNNWFKKNIILYFKLRHDNLLGKDPVSANMFAQRFTMQYPFVSGLPR